MPASLLACGVQKKYNRWSDGGDYWEIEDNETSTFLQLGRLIRTRAKLIEIDALAIDALARKGNGTVASITTKGSEESNDPALAYSSRLYV